MCDYHASVTDLMAKGFQSMKVSLSYNGSMKNHTEFFCDCYIQILW